MSGGPSLWRAALGSGSDPFADVARATGRGPGWARATGVGVSGLPGRGPILEARASAVSVGMAGRSDVAVGSRVFHSKFGYGAVTTIEGNKLEMDFEKAGSKRVLDNFVEVV